LLLGAGLLLALGPVRGQNEAAPPRAGRPVVATAVPVASPLQPAATAPANAGVIQQTSFVPDPPPPDPPPTSPPSRPAAGNGLVREASPPAILPATGLMSGLPAETKAPASAPGPGAALVAVEVVGPEQVTLGQPLAHEIIVRNAGNRTVGGVHVEEPLPAGARVLRADPPGQSQGERLTWDLGTLEAGTERRLKVEVQPAGAGAMQLHPIVTYQGGGVRTQVVQPHFAAEIKADHDRTTCGGRITFTIRLVNQGQTLIRGIKLYDQLPPGLQHPAGQLVGISRFGDLQPGESRTIKLETTAVQAGQFSNEVVAQADGGVEARAHIGVVVTEASLSLRLDGPKEGTTQRDLDFQIGVSNPGPAPATKVRLTQALPPSFDVVAASTGAGLDAAQHALVWSLNDLAPGQRQVVTFRVKAKTAGDWPLYTALLADNIPEKRVANVVRLQGAAALSLEVRAREDRLAVGEETVYEMHVFNQGDAACTGVRLTAVLPQEVAPLDAQGPMAGQVQQQTVQFPQLTQLPPRGDAVYRIRVRGQRPGKGRVHAELTAGRERPVQSDVSIQVNAGTTPPAGAISQAPASGDATKKPVAGSPTLY
jgi:uncharacterized repeat protein (TIGR01451 family)